MIAKISGGAKFSGLAAYLHGPGRENEHSYGMSEGGQVIGGNLLCEGDRDGHRWARDMNAAAAMRPDIEKPVWHMSLRAAPTDPVLTDEQWRDVAQHHAESMGWDRQPWVMVRHGEDHVHVVVSRVDFEGRVWNRRNDRYKAREACLNVERELGLKSTALDSPTKVQTHTQTRQHTAKLTQGEFARAERTGRIPDRVSLANVVRAARDHAVRIGGGREAFETALTERGVQWRANVASTGRMNGYSFHHAGHVDAQGAPIWLKASEVDRSLSWGRLSKSLTPRPAQVHVPPVEPKRFFERAASYEARVQAAQTRARQAFVDKSGQQMNRQLSQTTVQGALFWKARQGQKTVNAERWVRNVADRSARRAELAETMRVVRAGRPEGGRRFAPASAPTSATFRTAARGLTAAARAVADEASMERRRGGGMSR